MSQWSGSGEPRKKSTASAVLIGVLVGVLLFGLGVGGVFAVRTLTSGSDEPPPGPSASPRHTRQHTPTARATPRRATGPVPAGLQRFYSQSLEWKPCTGAHANDQCADLTVPMDYDKPGGRTISLAVLKVPATGKRIGSLVVNPGGPGGSALDYAAYGSLAFGTELPSSYDIVGIDPRGVGESTPLHCLSTAGLDRVIAADPDPDTAAERNHMDALIRGFGQGCLDRSGALARHMSTDEVAKDMDVLRSALGERRLDYFGASYGTLIGATYANLFPRNVGRMVLDGAIDPALSNAQLSLQQAHGFEVALRAYIANCTSSPGCVLGTSVQQGERRLQQFLASVERKPLSTSDGRKLTSGLAMTGIWLPLYAKSMWSQLDSALKAAISQHDGSQLLSLSDQYTSRGSGGYLDNSFEALYAVNCLDHDDYIKTSQVPAHFPQFVKASPTFGRSFAFSLSTCSTWPVKSGNHTVAMRAKGAPPIVVVGTTRDPATPLAWARALASELDSGVLVTRDGDGHTGFNAGNPCVDAAVNDYLIKGRVPKNPTSCPASG